MSDVNFSVVSGRLTRDPETRQTPSGDAVCDLSIAANRYNAEGKQFTTFIRVTLWNKAAEVLGERLHTGDHVMVQGQLVDDNFETTKGDTSTMTSGRLKIGGRPRVSILNRRDVETDTLDELHEHEELPVV